jgi:hypothetical protein
MAPCYFPPFHSPEGNHNIGSRVQSTSIGNEPMVSKNTKRAPTIKQENQDHPGKLLHDRYLLEHDTSRNSANKDRKATPAPVDYGIGKRRASAHPESEPVTKRAKKLHSPCLNYEGQRIAAVDCSNDVLRWERDVAKEDFSSSNATLREQMEAMYVAHKAAIQQKETELDEWEAKCQRQLMEQQRIEVNLVVAKQTIEVLQQDRSLEISELNEMVAAVPIDLDEAKGGHGIAKDTISNLEKSQGKLTAEQIKSLTLERDAAFRHTEKLETQLRSATEAWTASRSELEPSHVKVVELAAAIDGQEECVRETALQMKSIFRERESALADVTKLQSMMLTDSCQGHDVALPTLEANITKISALVIEQGVDNTQGLDLARPESETKINTVAELKNVPNASVVEFSKAAKLSGGGSASIGGLDTTTYIPNGDRDEAHEVAKTGRDQLGIERTMGVTVEVGLPTPTSISTTVERVVHTPTVERVTNYSPDETPTVLSAATSCPPRRIWTLEEDGKLAEAVKKHGNDWVAAAAMVPGRTRHQCHQRWTRSLDSSRKGKKSDNWKPEEDGKLVEAVKKHGNDWVAVAAVVPGRTNYQCYKRWTPTTGRSRLSGNQKKTSS